MNFPLEYDEMYAIEFERLEHNSFRKEFYQQIEQINYDRYIDGEKFKFPVFMDDIK